MEDFCFSNLEDDLQAKLSGSLFVEDATFLNLFQQLDVYTDSGIASLEGEKPLVIVGEAGVGKSLALAKWTARRKTNGPPTSKLDFAEFVFWHTIGVSRLSTQVTHLLRRLVTGLICHFDLKDHMDLADDKLSWILPRILERAAKKGRVVIVIDGLQYICSNDRDLGLKWLPLSVPPNVKMILSTTTPMAAEHDIDVVQTDHAKHFQCKVKQTWGEIQRRKWPTVPLECLQKESVESFIETYLSQLSQSHNRTLPPSQKNQLVEIISAHPLATNMRTATTFLKGIFHADSLGCNINQCLVSWMDSQTTTELIRKILSMLESGSPRKIGTMLGNALSLLFVARHGLHKNELFELLACVVKSESWEKESEGTVMHVKLKLLKMLMEKKKRLIDIFRSFDTDGNGTLSHEEFYAGMERLDIDVTRDEVTLLISDVDTNGDGEVDYQETLDHFEHLARSYTHGRRKASLFQNSSVQIRRVSSGSIKPLMVALQCLGVTIHETEHGPVLALPFENAIRDAIWGQYNLALEENKVRSYIVEHISENEPSLRYCEELPWLVKKTGRLSLLKKILIDLRALDIMFSCSELKSELLGYLKLIDGRFDIVNEYSQSMQQWVQTKNPPAKLVSSMAHFLAGVLHWFGKNSPDLAPSPPFMRPSVNGDYLRSIGIETAEGINASKSVQPLGHQRSRIQSEALYHFNRWVWSNFPWLALANTSATTSDHGHGRASPAPPAKTTTPDPEAEQQQLALSLRDKALAYSMPPNATLMKLEKLESSDHPRARTQTTIPFSSGTTWEKRGALGESNQDVADVEKRLQEIKQIYDSLVVESESKERRLRELRSVAKSRQIGDDQSKKNCSDREKALKSLQIRLEQLNNMLDVASNVERAYQDILLATHLHDPAGGQHIELEQQIELSRQQIKDLRREEDLLTKEIQKIEAESKRRASSTQQFVEERMKIKPLIEEHRQRIEEEAERRKAERVNSFDPSAFNRRMILEGKIAKRARERRNRRTTTTASRDEVMANSGKLHPMERLAKAAGTRDPAMIADMMDDGETRSLRERQERGEVELKELAAKLESLRHQVKQLSLTDENHQASSSPTTNEVLTAKATLSQTQERLRSTSQIVLNASLAIVALNDMVRSSEADQLTDFAIKCSMIEAKRREEVETDSRQVLKLIKSLHSEVPADINNLLEQKRDAAADHEQSSSYQNLRVLNKAEVESLFATETKHLHDIADNDSDEEYNEQNADEDFGKLATFVHDGISTNASRNQQRRANCLSHAKQGKYASKGLVLEAVLAQGPAKV